MGTRDSSRPPEQQYLAGILAALRDGIVIRSLDGRVLDVNDAFLAMVGLRRDEVIGLEGPPYPWHAAPEDAEVAARRIRETEGVHLKEIVFRRPDGETFPVQVSGGALRDPAGEVVAYLASCRDVGPLRRAEDEALRLEQAQRDALAQLAAERDAREMKDEFLAMVSHEIRTPLTSVLGYQELALADTTEEGVRSLLEVANRNGRHLARLVDDFQLIGRASVGRLVMQRRPVALSDLVRQAVQDARIRTAAAEVTFEEDVADGIVIDADAGRVSQVLDNLLANAVVLSPHGARVRVVLAADDASATVSVADQGPGIPAREQRRIFDPFYRADHSGEEVEGTGLDLAVSKAIMDAHEGTLAVSSAPGGETVFSAVWPREPGLSAAGGAPRSS